MHVSWSWLGRHVDLTGVDAHEVIGRFTLGVAEVEGIEEVGAELAPVVAGRVLEVRAHPDAERLKVARVATGTQTVEVVCGAPNCAVGGVYPLALAGTRLPGGLVEAATIRGVASVGMLCSERDLGLTDDHGGLMLLGGAEPGAALTGLLPVTDVVFEVDNKSITHRPDLWGHRGMAREVAALVGRPLRALPYALTFTDDDPLTVVTEAPDLCPRYTAVRYAGVRVERSPLWLRLALERVGVRAISNVVDLSNFVMLDTGNPIHAFDARFLRDATIRVRRATQGERMHTLDGVERALGPADLVIADGQGAIALAGVMGGADSEIRADTAEVVLESATFQPGSVRRTSLRLGLRTEASARFEKSLDPALALDAQVAFGSLLQELVPGTHVTSRLYDVDHSARPATRITVPAGLFERKLGARLPEGFAQRTLRALGFGITAASDGSLDVEVPSWRATKDVAIKEDLIEEVGRAFGYDHITPEPPRVRVEEPHFRLEGEARWTATRALAMDAGLHQVQTYSFVSNTLLAAVGGATAGTIALRNPISSDLTHMRTALGPNLLGVAQTNHRTFDAVRVFEIGRVFLPQRDDDGLPLQPRRVGMLVWRRGAGDEVYTEVKGVVEALLTRFRVPDPMWEPGAAGEVWLHPGKAARVSSGGTLLGGVALAHPRAAESLKLDNGRAALAELDLDLLCAAWQRRWSVERLARVPGVRYEISAIVAQDVPHERVQRAIRAADPDLVREVRFLTAYAGAPIPEGEKSLSYEILFRRDDRTLTDDEANRAAARVIERLEAEVGAYLREA